MYSAGKLASEGDVLSMPCAFIALSDNFSIPSWYWPSANENQHLQVHSMHTPSFFPLCIPQNWKGVTFMCDWQKGLMSAKSFFSEEPFCFPRWHDGQSKYTLKQYIWLQVHITLVVCCLYLHLHLCI